MVLVVFLPYIYVFAKNGVSHQVEYWAYLGNYMSGTLGIVSIFLLYITYREQRFTNHIDQFEKLFFYHVDNIKKLQQGHQEVIQTLYNKIVGLFLYVGDYQFNNEFTKEQVRSVIQYAYSYFVNNGHKHYLFEILFQYIEYTLNHVEKDALIDSKDHYSMEIKIILKLETKIMMFCYILVKDKKNLLDMCIRYEIFKDWELENDMFNQIVSMYCNYSQPVIERSDAKVTIDLYKIDNNTTFFDILKYLQKMDSSEDGVPI